MSLYATKAMSLERVLEAAHAQAAAAPNAPVLVSVFLPGGCDLLDTLPPLGPARAATPTCAARSGRSSAPGSARPASACTRALSEGAGGGVHGLYERGKVGFLPGIDYANPDLSHFHSRHFWETGLIIAASPRRAGSGAGSIARARADNPLQGLSLGGYAVARAAHRRRPGRLAGLAQRREARLRGTWGVGDDKAADAWGRLADRLLVAARPRVDDARRTARADRRRPARALRPRARASPTRSRRRSPTRPENDLADELSRLAAPARAAARRARRRRSRPRATSTPTTTSRASWRPRCRRCRRRSPPSSSTSRRAASPIAC